jgi:FAD:protein FMN transferase
LGLLLTALAQLAGITGLTCAEEGAAMDGCQRQVGVYRFSEVHLAVDVTLQIASTDQHAAEPAAKLAYQRIEELNKVFSDYDPESELSLLGRKLATEEQVVVSKDMERVLGLSLALAAKSEGAFDPTIAQVVKLWRRARRQGRFPDQELLNEGLARTGYGHLSLDPTTHAVTSGRRPVSLDFGGIAKGDIAEEAWKTLKEAGYPASLVAVAGDIYAGDPPPGRPAWTVELQFPASLKEYSKTGEPVQRVDLNRSAISTSGDEFQHVEIDGVRYSHIVDPRTGLGVTRQILVTVTGPSGTLCDGLATAISVLGREAGAQLISGYPGYSAQIFELQNESVVVSRTNGFPEEAQAGGKAP